MQTSPLVTPMTAELMAPSRVTSCFGHTCREDDHIGRVERPFGGRISAEQISGGTRFVCGIFTVHTMTKARSGQTISITGAVAPWALKLIFAERTFGASVSTSHTSGTPTSLRLISERSG